LLQGSRAERIILSVACLTILCFRFANPDPNLTKPDQHVRNGDVLGGTACLKVRIMMRRLYDSSHLMLICRTITAAAVLLSIPVTLGVINPFYVVFVQYYILTLRTFPQIWRLVTPFLLTGPGLGLLLDPYFLYTYGSALETEASRFSQPGDFFVYLVFVALVILVSLLPLYNLRS
jgi:membrane associated rhomboid family serine protease